jgi:archaellum component FlaC
MTFAKPHESENEDQPAEDTEETAEGGEEPTPDASGEVLVAFNHDHEEVGEMSIPTDRELPLRDAVEATGIVVERTFHELREQYQEMEDANDETREELGALQEEVAGLRDEIEGLNERLESLEGWRGRTVQTVNNNISDINRLAAAVFDEARPCPECDDGDLEADIGGWGGDTIGCTECEYETEVGDA